MIPDPGTSVLINDYPIEITRTTKNAILTAKVPIPKLEPSDDSTDQDDNG